jgi:hypothetical protein
MKNEYRNKIKKRKVHNIAKAILKYRNKKYTRTMLPRPKPYHDQVKEFVVGEIESLPVEFLAEKILKRV